MSEYAAGLEQALAELKAHFENAGAPHMLIGGLALAAWGLPRATLDIDVTVWVAPDETAHTIDGLAGRFISRSADPHRFVLETRVLPLSSASGIRIDILFGAFPFEREMTARAVTRPIGEVQFRVATIEDLLLTKLISLRPKDAADVDTILRAYRRRLDWEYLLPIATQLAESVEMPDLVAKLDPYRS